MNKQKVIMINGAAYDAHTGMRLTEEVLQDQARSATQQAHVSHKKQSRSQTLTRSHVTSPHKKARQHAPVKAEVKRSPMISKFSTSDITPRPAAKKAPTLNDIAPTRHPIQAKVEAQKAAKKQPIASQAATPQPKPAEQIKRQSIEKALQNAKSVKKEKRSFTKRHPRLVSISSATLAVALLGGYLTYLNLPTISVRVAAAQAGIAATYPSYQPSGYSLNGPVAYTNGQVTMKFAANVGPQKFAVNQTKSSWDSSALLENYVEDQSRGDYQTLSDGGLTIYAYGNNAAWVNGGILHTIEGDAPLSPDQIRRIATSM